MMLPLLEQKDQSLHLHQAPAFMIYLKISLVVACLLSFSLLVPLGNLPLPGLYLFEINDWVLWC